MSLIDLASLVLAPTAVKDGKVYNAIPNDQDFTFSRGTEATRVNSSGLVEKARTNFLLQSNSFDTTWTANSSSVTGGQSGYDGSNDAWELTKSASYGSIVQQVINSGVLTVSVYLKANTSDFGSVRLSSGSGNDIRVKFDLTDGSISYASANDGTYIVADTQSIGNGWYRCSITGNMTASSTIRCNIYAGDTADSSGSIYIQDAQLEQGLVATDYIDTTTSSVTVGITDDLPRVDYSGGGCPSLLLEPSRTNVVTSSEYFLNSANVSVSYNNATSPEGVQNATYITGDAGTLTKFVDANGASAGAYTVSIFAKYDSHQWIQLGMGGIATYANFDIQNGVVGGTNGTSDIEDYGNGWYRCSVNAVSGTPLSHFVLMVDSGSAARLASSSSTGSLWLYGLQSELGSYVSSYIPTYGTSTSRSADSCSLTNASNLIGQTEGTLFVEYTSSHEGSAGERIFAIGDGTSSNRIVLFEASNKIRVYAANGGSLQWDYISTIDFEGTHKIAVGYAENNAAIYIDGTQLGTDTTFNVPSCSRVYVGTSEAFGTSLGGGVNETILFPTRLTNDQLQELTK